MLRGRIHQTRRDLALVDRALLAFHLQLSEKLRGVDRDVVDGLTSNSFESVRTSTAARDQENFERLRPTENNGQTHANIDTPLILTLIHLYIDTSRTVTVLGLTARFLDVILNMLTPGVQASDRSC